MTDNCAILLEPLSQSEQERSTTLPSLNYTNQDFNSMKTRLVNFIRQKYPDDFNDFVEGDLGIMLIENWAFLADTLSFKMDQIVNELFIDTVTELENAFRLSKLVGFQPTPPVAARALFQATIPQAMSVDISIPGGSQVETSSAGLPLTYELFPADASNNAIFDQDIILPAGSLTNSSLIGLEGSTVTDNFASDGSANQALTLTNVPVLYDSVRVDVDGVRWDQVDYFTDSHPRAEYRLEYDSSFRGYLLFGNSRAGLVPSNGSQIVVTYRTGNGTRGNVITGAINQTLGISVPGVANLIPVSFRNYTKGEFGYNGDTIDDIRRKLPAFVRTQDRAVTGDDYKTLANQFVTPYNGQVGKATAVLRNTGCAGNIVDIYVLAASGDNGLAEAGDDLKVSLSDHLDEKKMLTDFVCVRDGVVVSVDVNLDVTIPKFYRKFKDELERKVKARVDAFFDLSNWDYGQSLREADLIKSLSDIKEIDSIDVSFTTDDPDNSGSVVSAAYYEVVRPDTITTNLIFD